MKRQVLSLMLVGSLAALWVPGTVGAQTSPEAAKETQPGSGSQSSSAVRAALGLPSDPDAIEQAESALRNRNEALNAQGIAQPQAPPVRAGIVLTDDEAKLFDSHFARAPEVGRRLFEIVSEFDDELLYWRTSTNVVLPKVTLLAVNGKVEESVLSRVREAVPSGWRIEIEPSALSRSDWLKDEKVLKTEIREIRSGKRTDGVLAKIQDAGLVIRDIVSAPWRAGIDVRVDPKTLTPERVATASKALSTDTLGKRLTFSPGGVRKQKDGRTLSVGAIKGGMRMSNSEDTLTHCTTAVVLRNLNNPAQRFVLTAGHCVLDEDGAVVPTLTTLYHNGGVLGTLYQQGGAYAAVNDTLGRDGALYQIDAGRASGIHIHQTPETVLFQQGTPYTTYWNAWSQVQPGEERMVCFEGSSTFRYEHRPTNATVWPNLGDFNGLTSCGLSYGVSYWWNDYQIVNMYPNVVVCGGDSGALVRYPSGTSSVILGVVSYTEDGEPADTRDGSDADLNCAWFNKWGSQLPYPNVAMGYSDYTNLVNYFNGQFGMNLVPVYNDPSLKFKEPGTQQVPQCLSTSNIGSALNMQPCSNTSTSWTNVGMNLGNTDQYLLWNSNNLCAQGATIGVNPVGVSCTWWYDQIWHLDAIPNAGNTFRIRNSLPTPLAIERQSAGLRMATSGTQPTKAWTVLP